MSVGIKFCMFQWVNFIGVQKIVQLMVVQRILMRLYFRRMTEVETLVVRNT